mmetsp:Transcript_95/g.206  ORF Transcript_95/g.206 Transcript_95/m.206 type:complete len:439 (+) Transcript_95:82-1398(+)
MISAKPPQQQHRPLVALLLVTNAKPALARWHSASIAGQIPADMVGVLICIIGLMVCFAIWMWQRNHPHGGKERQTTATSAVDTEAAEGQRRIVDLSLTQCQACGRRFRVDEEDRALRMTCPHCAAVVEFSFTEECAGIRPPQAPVPSYWTNDRSRHIKKLDEEMVQAMQALLDSMRENQENHHGARLGDHTKEVLIVHRNESLVKWDRYARTRARIAEQCKGCEQPTVKTLPEGTPDSKLPQLFQLSDLHRDCNEFYLFHTTNTSTWKATIRDVGTFQLSEPIDGTGSLYGPGLYFSESISKAETYATEDPDPQNKGVFVMSICRVACGDVQRDTEDIADKDVLVNNIVKHRRKHSILRDCPAEDAELGRGPGREFVVFDRTQVHAEFTVFYHRVPIRMKPEGDLQSCPTPSNHSEISTHSPLGDSAVGSSKVGHEQH